MSFLADTAPRHCRTRIPCSFSLLRQCAARFSGNITILPIVVEYLRDRLTSHQRTGTTNISVRRARSVSDPIVDTSVERSTTVQAISSSDARTRGIHPFFVE